MRDGEKTTDEQVLQIFRNIEAALTRIASTYPTENTLAERLEKSENERMAMASRLRALMVLIPMDLSRVTYSEKKEDRLEAAKVLENTLREYGEFKL